MNERLPRQPDLHDEIDDARKQVFVDKAREKAPYEGQPINPAGLYSASYLYGLGHVTIDIPVRIDYNPDNEDNLFLSDGVTVLVCEQSHIDTRYVLMKMQQYIVYLDDMVGDYSKSERVYDLEKDEWAEPAFADDSLEQALGVHDIEKELGLTVFTREHFDEVCSVLDKLSPSDRI